MGVSGEAYSKGSTRRVSNFIPALQFSSYLCRSSDVQGRRGKVVFDGSGIVWSHRVWCAVQVWCVHANSEPSGLDLEGHRDEHKAATS